MEPKNLLLHLDHSIGCRNRLECAFSLARDYDARISGLFVVPDYIVPAYVEAQISVDLISDITDKALARAEETLTGYRRLADEAGVTMEARVIEGQVIPVLREYSKYADLLLLGQDHPDDPDNASYGLADALLFEGGCACLVVPHSGQLAAPGRRILLAWNGSRESARALREGLPFLKRADNVSVLASSHDPAAIETEGDDARASELARFLGSHGIDTEPLDSGRFGAHVSPGEAILAQAAECNADLIVMGAYGHARLREIILGGVTRDLLAQSSVPLLLAH